MLNTRNLFELREKCKYIVNWQSSAEKCFGAGFLTVCICYSVAVMGN